MNMPCDRRHGEDGDADGDEVGGRVLLCGSCRFSKRQ